MSTQVWVDEVRDMLLSGYVEDLDIITGSVGVSDSEIIVQGYAGSIVKGVVRLDHAYCSCFIAHH